VTACDATASGNERDVNVDVDARATHRSSARRIARALE
jgi:hypothetical protein